jgi:SAM-dependent methyltransferase
MYDDEKLRFTLAAAQRSISDLESPPPSRLIGLGRFARGVIRRVLRFALAPQLEFDRAVREGLDAAGQGLDAQGLQLAEQAQRLDAAGQGLDAQGLQLAEQAQRLDAAGQGLDAQGLQLAEQAQRVDALAAGSAENTDGLRTSVERIEGSLQKLFQDINAEYAGQIERTEGLEERLAEQSQRIDAQMDRVDQLMALSSENAGGLRASVERTEGLEGFLPKLLQDIHTDFAEARAVQASMGRQIDEVGGELVANTLDVKKFRKRIDELQRSTTSAEDRIRTVEERFEPLVDLDHFDFAKAYRGDETVIQARLEGYARSYGPVKRILDFGCGRGEFLQMCSKLNIGAYGVDRDPDMISHCKLQSLDAIEGDALQHLQELPARSLDGIFSAQVVEHLTPAEIVQLIRLASEKLKRGGKIIIETINPNTWSAMRWFYLDPSHSQPVPADMLRFFLEEANFEIVDTLYSSPVAEGERLSFVKMGTEIEDSTLADFLVQNNENVQRLNDLLFGPQDYAIVAER